MPPLWYPSLKIEFNWVRHEKWFYAPGDVISGQFRVGHSTKKAIIGWRTLIGSVTRIFLHWNPSLGIFRTGKSGMVLLKHGRFIGLVMIIKSDIQQKAEVARRLGTYVKSIAGINALEKMICCDAPAGLLLRYLFARHMVHFLTNRTWDITLCKIISLLTVQIWYSE